jgi:erythromycin esterase
MVLLSPAGLKAASVPSQDLAKGRADATRFITWAQEASVALTATPGSRRESLRPLGRMIGDATVVAATEAVHLGAEPLEFRNRLLKYLVEEKGFTAIAIESGIVEGRTVDDYVHGGPGELSAILAGGISWTFDRLPQNEALVRWLRQYNADPRHARKISFYGFDVPGSPGNPKAKRGLEIALTEALGFLDCVDSAAARDLRFRLDPLLKSLRFDPGRAHDALGYDRLRQPDRDVLTAAIADLIELLERREAAYTAASSTDDYDWACRAAIGARQIDNWLRRTPLDWQPAHSTLDLHSEQSKFLSVAADTRDRAQADNLDWIIRREGPGGKVLVYAARYHLSAAPVMTSWGSSAGEPSQEQEVAGTYLHRRFGKRFVNIGNLIGTVDIVCGEDTQQLAFASPGSFEELASQVGSPSFLLDLRTAPPQIANWLGQVSLLAQGARLALGKAFDIVFYVDTVTSACGQQLTD